jgi:hypothetical protein
VRRIHRLGHLTTILVLTLALLSVAAGRRSSSGSLSIAGPSPYRFGQMITFAVSAPEVAQPYVLNQCSQNGTVV